MSAERARAAAVSAWRRLAGRALRAFDSKAERDVSVLAVTAGLFIAPFAVQNVLRGRVFLGAIIALLSLWFVANGVAARYARRALPNEVVLLPALGVLGLALSARGDLGIFWGFPAALLFHFVLRARIANLYNLAVLLMVAPAAWMHFGADIGMRVAVTLLLTVLFANLFSYLTQRQHAREQEKERQLALLVHATKAGFSDWDAVANTIGYSERFKEMLGYPRDFDTSAWRSFFDLVHPEDRHDAKAEFHAMLKRRRLPGLQEPGEALEYRLLTSAGGAVWVHAESLAEVGADGRIRRFVTSYLDITKFREQTEALATEQRRLDLVVRAQQVGIVDWDGRTHATYYSPRFKAMLGYAEDVDTSGWPDYFSRVHPEDQARVHKRFREHIVDERNSRLHEPIQYRLRRADGSYVWIEALGASLRDERGFASRFIASIADISERRAQEEALRTEQRRLDLVVRAARVGIVDWDGVTHATYYSPRFKEILGWPPDADTSGWPDYFKVLIHPEDRERIVKRWRGFIFGSGPEGPRGEYYAPEEYRLRRRDGSYVWVQVSGQAVRDEKNFVTRWIAATTDVTERRAQEEALRESVRLREEVERMSRHDLKTPLNSVIAMSRLLRESGRLAPEDRELLGTIERAGTRILTMVNLSLDLFRMESGTYQLHPRAVDVAEVARRVAADLESQAASKNVDVRVRANNASAASNPVHASAEEILCYSMLANLVKNAIEAAPEGSGVSIDLHSETDSVNIRIHNKGAVAEEMRERFFEKYARAGKSAGLGLGTYSARLMARVQGGEVSMETSEAAGTTLSVRLKAVAEGLATPAAPGEGAVPRALERARETLPPLSVLVVDDDEFNRLVLRRTLPHPPLRLSMAVNGRAALEAAGHDWPDVVLLDLEMPVMDGYEAARLFRKKESEERRPRLTIIAISSNDEQAIIDKALAAGCDHYLTKPAPREALWRLLSGVSSKRQSFEQPVVVDSDLEDVMPEFLASRREILARMPAALEAGDREQFRKLAHVLAGSLALYGFAWAATRCRELQRDAAAAEPAALVSAVAAVREHLDSVPVRFRRAAEGE